MFYTVYKITNKINDKTYIGMHQTKNLDDGYMGSGKLLKRAIDKYGIEQFEKKILHVFDNEDDMRSKEKELVVISEHTYNLCEGGKGGFGYIQRHPDYKKWTALGAEKINNLGFNGGTLRKGTSKYTEKIKCGWCKNMFVKTPHKQKFCSRSCANSNTNKNYGSRYKKLPV